jgi:hypothetical protein
VVVSPDLCWKDLTKYYSSQNLTPCLRKYEKLQLKGNKHKLSMRWFALMSCYLLFVLNARQNSHLGGVVFVAMGIEICGFVDVGDPISFPVSHGAL